MKLSKQEATLFFQLIWTLQFYVNNKLKIYPRIKSIEDYADSDTEQKVKVRNALYDNIEIIDSFVKENPQGLTAQKLAIIANWKNNISGNFIIERLLNKYAVFIQEDKVYGVLGLSQGFDELTINCNIPTYVNTVLLPFKGKIIYDGLLGFQNIYFGSNIKRNLRETYMREKQNNRIIVSLEISSEGYQKKAKDKSIINMKPELDELSSKVKKLRGSVEHPALYSPAFSLIKASINFTKLVVSDSNDLKSLNEALQKVRRAYNKTVSVLNREEY